MRLLPLEVIRLLDRGIFRNMLKTTRCPKCGHEFEQLRTNKLDHLVLAHKLRGIISPYAIGSQCPRCSRDCTDVAEIHLAGFEAAKLYLPGTDLAESETSLTVEVQIDESPAVRIEESLEVPVIESLPLYETSESDQFVTQLG